MSSASPRRAGRPASRCSSSAPSRTGATAPIIPKADSSHEAPEILAAFLAQFYDDKPIPDLVLLSHEIEERELLEEALSTHAGRRIEVAVPQRGEKKTLVEHAVTNAREALGRKMAESSSQAKLLEGVQRAFGLAEAPRRIEVYDNSHIQGTNPVGAMIVAGPDGFIKSQYRKFNIRSEEIGSDDFAMMREVLTRRFSRLLKEQGEERGDEQAKDVQAWPDLVLIDGGQGQLSAAKAVLDELGLSDLPVAGVAKGPDRDAGREHFYVPGTRLLHARGARPGALLHPAPARRGAPLCHRLAPGQALQGHRHQPAGRGSGHWTLAQESLAAGLRFGQSSVTGQRHRPGRAWKG